MRFNPLPRRDIQEEVGHQNQDMKRGLLVSKFKRFIKILFLIIIVLAVLFGSYKIFKASNNSVVADSIASPYYAVFLSNGQVYFGKLVHNNKYELTLTDVYRLQVPDDMLILSQEQITTEPFTLVRLNQEVHGPTNNLFVNKAHLLFYEQLSNESSVVKSIRAQ